MGERFSLDLGLAFGYKVFTASKTMMREGDNRFDVLFDAAIPFQVNDTLYVSPPVHMTWTNLDQVEDEDGNAIEATMGDEYMVYFSLNVGGDF